MADRHVVYVRDLKCSSCESAISGCVELLNDGLASATCPRCGSAVVRQLAPETALQTAPSTLVEPGDTVTCKSVYARLYDQPRHHPGYRLQDLISVAFAPTRTLASLFLSSSVKHAMVLVAIFATVSTFYSVFATNEMADVIGYSKSDAFELGIQAVVGWVVFVFSFLAFCVMAALISQEIFGGRGDKGATVTLVAYCFPWFVVLSALLLSIFALGFQGLDLARVQTWSDAEMEQAIASGAVFLTVAVCGIIWLLHMVGVAVGVANDITTGSGVLAAVLSALGAGILSLLASAFLSLAITISL